MNETTEITTLENGLRVATETMASVQTASVGVWIDVGARLRGPAADAAEGGTEHDGDPLGRGGDRRARQQILGRREQELRRPTSDTPRAGQRAQLLDLAAASHSQIVDRKALDHRDAVAAGDQPRPERVEIGAERGHNSRSDEADGLSALSHRS